MRKNFLFATLAVLLAGFWFGGASLADDNVARISSGDVFTSLQDAIDNASETDTVTLILHYQQMM